MGISQSLPALRRRGYELCEQQAVWTNLVYYVLVKRYTGRLYVEVWRHVPLASAIAPPMSNFTKEIRPSHIIAVWMLSCSLHQIAMLLCRVRISTMQSVGRLLFPPRAKFRPETRSYLATAPSLSMLQI